MNLLTLRGVHWEGEGCAVLRDLDITLLQGDSLALVCADARVLEAVYDLLSGRDIPDGGHIDFAGLPPFERRRSVSENVGFVKTNVPLDRRMKIGDWIGLMEDFQKTDTERLTRWLSLFDILPFGRIGTLSLGRQALLVLLAGLAQKKDTLVVLNPLLGVEETYHAAVLQILRDLQQEGVTLLVLCPTLAVAKRACRRVALMQNGTVAMLRDAEALRHHYAKVYHISFETEDEAYRFVQNWGRDAEMVQQDVVVTVPDAVDQLIKALAPFKVLALYGGQDRDARALDGRATKTEVAAEEPGEGRDEGRGEALEEQAMQPQTEGEDGHA